MSARCVRPLEAAALLDYWFGDGEVRADEAIEEHLMECDPCSERLRQILAVGEGVRRLARQGALEMVVTPSFLERARREGLRTREYRVAPGGRVDCTVTSEDDLLVAHLTGDFRDVAHLDVVAQIEGQPEHRIRDVPVDPRSSELIVAQAMPAVRAFGRSLFRLRLLALEQGGGERVVGEYLFDHTPTVDPP